MNYQEFAKKYNLVLSVSRIPFRSNISQWEDTAKHFAYTIECREGERSGQKIRGHYSQGSGIKGQPKMEDILNSLSLDTQGIENTTFKMWASDYGYSEDSIKAYDIFRACLDESEQLKKVVGIEGLSELHEIESL